MRPRLLLPIFLLSLGAACTASTHPSRPSLLGQARRSSELLAVINEAGPLEVETINSSDWKVDRSGLVNLDHPKARTAGLEDSPEPIHIYFHVIRHPTHGTFLVDSGVERAARDAPEESLFNGLIGKVMHREWLGVKEPLGDWLSKQSAPPSGVLLTHLHLDHVSGLPDVPAGTELYAGPNETTGRAFLNLFTRGVIDRALEGKGPVNTWQFVPDADGRFEGVIDIFGDGSLWALWVPGHTAGSTAYLARTKDGPVLFVGDTSHTAWGWHNEVEPGSFTADQTENAVSLRKLRQLVTEHPRISVRLGHQPL